MPWADQPGAATSSGRAAARRHRGAGFSVGHWADLTDPAASLMQAVLSQPPAPLGLHAFVPGFAAKAANLTKGLASGPPARHPGGRGRGQHRRHPEGAS